MTIKKDGKPVVSYRDSFDHRAAMSKLGVNVAEFTRQCVHEKLERLNNAHFEKHGKYAFDLSGDKQNA